MSRLIRKASIPVLFLLAAGALFGEASKPKDSSLAYPLAICVGFGIGHYYIGQNGAPFLIVDLISTAGIAAGYVIMARSFVMAMPPRNPGSSSGSNASIDPHIGFDIWFAASLVLAICRVWQVVDIFRAVEVARKLGTVVEAVPVVNIQVTSYEIGVALRY